MYLRRGRADGLELQLVAELGGVRHEALDPW